MVFNINLKQKLVAQIARLTSSEDTQCAGGHDKALPQNVYESIAVGNALADIEDDANRRWRGQ